MQHLSAYPLTLLMRAVSVACTASLHLLIARSMTPDAYAAVAMTQVLLLLFAMLADYGMETRLIIDTKAGEALRGQLRYPLLAAMALFVFLLISADSVERLLDIELLSPVLTFAAIALPLQALQLAPRAAMYRKQQYQEVAKQETAANTAAWALAIIVLILQDGLWSFCVYVISLHAIRALLLWRASGLRFLSSLDSGWTIGDYLKGGSLFAIAAFNFLEMHYDDLIIAVNLGGAALSMYQLSYTVILLQQDFISGVMKKISLPAYVSRLREGKRAVLSQFTFDTRLLVAVSGPLLLGIALFADPLLLIVLNESWMEALPVLRILCIETLRQSLLSLAAPALLALGKEAAMLRYSRLSAVILVASFTALSYTNLFIFVSGYFIINSALNLYYFDITRKALGTRGQEIAAAMLPGLLGATVTFLIWSLLVVLGANDALMIAGILPATLAGFATAAAVSGEIPRALRQMTAGIFGTAGRRLPDTISVHTDAAFSDYNPHLKSLHLAIQEKDTRFVFIELHFRNLLRATFSWPFRTSTPASRELLHLHFPALLYNGGSLPFSVLRAAKYFLIISCLRLRGFTFLLTMHDDRAHEFDHRRFERLYLFLLVQSAEIVLTLSQAGADMLRDRFARNSGVFVTPHPVYDSADIGAGEQMSRQRREARQHFMLNEHDMVLLMFGTNASYKGYDDALVTLKNVGAPISLICAGRGMSSLPLESLPLDIRLILLDQRLDDIAAARCFLAADYCLLPYRHILHSGTAMLAATYSCPIIAPRTGVFRDIEAQHAIAVLYDTEDKQALAGAIRVAIETPRSTYAESFRDFRRSYSREIARDTTMQAYYGLFETFSAHTTGD